MGERRSSGGRSASCCEGCHHHQLWMDRRGGGKSFCEPRPRTTRRGNAEKVLVNLDLFIILYKIDGNSHFAKLEYLKLWSTNQRVNLWRLRPLRLWREEKIQKKRKLNNQSNIQGSEMFPDLNNSHFQCVLCVVCK